jgi:hypothetical protein
MGPLTYKVSNLHFYKQSETSHLTLATTISPPKCESFNSSCFPSRGSFFSPTYTCTVVVVLNGTHSLTTFDRKTFDTRSRSNPSLNYWL